MAPASQRDLLRRRKTLIGVFVLLAIAAVPVTVIAQSRIWRLGPDPFPVLSDYFETFPTPDEIAMVKEDRAGEGDPFFGEHAQLRRYYESESPIGETCALMHASFQQWTTASIEYRANPVTAPAASCEMFAAKKAPPGVGGDGGVAARIFVYETDAVWSDRPTVSPSAEAIVLIDLTD